MGIYEDPQKARREQQERERLERERQAKAKVKADADADAKAKARAKAKAKAKTEASDPTSATKKPALLYGSGSFVYGQGSVPLAPAFAPKPEPVVPDHRKARIWGGEKAKPESEADLKSLPFKPRDMESVKERVLRRIALRKQAQESLPLFPVAPEVKLAGATVTPGMLGALSQRPEPIQVARGQGGGVPQQFQDRLKEGAIHRLEQNKARLTQVQGTYQNTQTSNKQWETLRTLANRDVQLKRMQDQTNQELMVLIAKKEFSNTLLGRLANQTPLGKLLEFPKSAPIEDRFSLNVLGVSPQDVDPKYREQFTGLQSRLELLHSVRQEMRAVHPALAVVDTEAVAGTANTPEQNAKIYREMGQGFDGMRSNMRHLSEAIAQDPSKALLFDALETQTLNTFKNPADRQAAQQWAQQQKDKDATLKTVVGMGAVGLAVGSAFAGPLGWGAKAALGLFRGSAALGMGLAAYEFPQVMVMDMAARAGEAGGQKLTNQTPEEARMNLALGYANLALAGLDVGLTPGLIAKVGRFPGAVKSAAALTRRQSQVLVNSVARHSGTLTDAALERLLSAVRVADEGTTAIVINSDGTLTQTRPLGGVTDRLESTVAARASGRVARSVEGYENAAKVKSLIGRKFNLSQLPEGYKYAKIPLEDGSVREVIYLSKSNNKMVPLEVDKDGLIQVGAKGEYRVVRDKYYNQNFETIPGEKGTKVFKGKGSSWIHHMVPDNVMRSDPLYQRAFELGIFNPDRTSNLIELAGNEEALKAGRQFLDKNHPGVKVSDFTHYTQHPKYDGIVRQQISDEIKLLKKQSSLTILDDNSFIHQMKPEEIQKVIRKMENRMRRGLMNEDPRLNRLI